MADELVHYDLDGGVATITLDSPHNRNALSAQLRRELTDALAKAVDDEHARVIVLTHTGTVFCAGMDLKEAKGADSEEQGVNGFPAILERLWTSPKPVVAKLAGPARAGGVGMVAAADIAVASTAATFAFTEVRIGVVPALISVPVLPRLAPRAAHELFLTGDTFDATRAVEVGLLNAAVAPDELDAKVAAYVDSLVRGGPAALAATKDLLQGERGRTMGDELQKMQAVSAHYFASDEGQEGIAAFGEKRPPRWAGVPTQSAAHSRHGA